MKELVVISGKGGTGKTSVTAAFGVLAGNRVVLADCDVDAANMHIVMAADFSNEHEFISGELAVIEQDKCIPCGECMKACRFDAVRSIAGRYEINPYKCEGCGLCARVCPHGAIVNEDLHAGKYFISRTRTGGTMVHARLAPGASNSGKLVSKVKDEARKVAAQNGQDIILVDGSPGIGCPVISSLSGASAVILVTEPSLSGLHDLKRIVSLVENFKIPAFCLINKSDLSEKVSASLKGFLAEKQIPLLGELPYDRAFSDALMQMKTIVETDGHELGGKIRKYWENVLELIKI